MKTVNINTNLKATDDPAIEAYTDDPGPRVASCGQMTGDGRLAVRTPDCVGPPGHGAGFVGLNVRVRCAGYKEQTIRVQLGEGPGWQGEAFSPEDPSRAVPLIMEPSVVPFPGRVVARAPLPPFPPNALDNSPAGSYGTTLGLTPPPLADKRYWRANFGTVTVPGLPFVPGMEPTNFDRVLTGFFGRYTPDWQATIASTYAERGYTHFLRWVQDEQSVPGFSIEKYVDECHRLHDAGIPFIAHSFLSKVYAPSSPDAKYLAATFDPLIEALQNDQVLDLAVVGFELTEVYPNDSLQVPIDYFVTRGLTEAHGCPLYVHHISEYTWPGVGAPDRRQWWDRYGYGKLTGLLYQCDPAWSIADAQARYRDTTDNAGEGFPNTDSGFGHPFDFVVLETQLARAFGHDSPNEDDLDLFGYLSLCTPGQLPVMGFGCGARRPDGTYL